MSIRILFWRSFYKIVNPFRRLYWRIVQPHTRGTKCLIQNGDMFLLVRLSYAHKQWTLPGGGVERRELFEQAAYRELHEETGLQSVPLTFFAEYKSRREYKYNTVQCFYGETERTHTTIDPLEIAESGWFTRENFPANRSPGIDMIMSLYDEWEKA